jgi:hypothetical protein
MPPPKALGPLFWPALSLRSRRAWRRLKGLQMSVTTLENLLKVMREKLPQKDLNRTIIVAIDEIIREIKRLDGEMRRAKRTISRRF